MDNTLQLALGFACLVADLWFFLNLWPILTCQLFPCGDTEKISSKIILVFLTALFAVVSGFLLKDHFVNWTGNKNTNDWYVYLPLSYVAVFAAAFLMALGIIDTVRKNQA